VTWPFGLALPVAASALGESAEPIKRS